MTCNEAVAMAAVMIAFYAGWVYRRLQERRQSYWLDYHRRRRSNPPPGDAP